MSVSHECKIQHGFTLIEALVALGVLGVMLILVAPALRKTSARADELTHLNRIRGHAQIMTMYIGDYQDAWPAVDPRSRDGQVSVMAAGVNVKFPYFLLHGYWPALVVDRYYNGSAGGGVFHVDKRARGLFTQMYLSSSFQAGPEYWRPETREGPHQWRSTRSSEVSYPSAKVMLSNIHQPPKDARAEISNAMRVVTPRAPAALVDGSARGIAPTEAVRGYLQGDGRWSGCFFDHPLLGLHTVGGVQGRDVK